MPERFYLAPQDIRGDEAVLRGKEAHHAVRVMRMKVGEHLTLFDGEGHEYRGRIREILKEEVAVLIEERLAEEFGGVSVTVACALPKRLRMESVIEKLTELGVEAILPFSTERSVPRVKPEEQAKKISRFQRIAAEAAKQCGTSRLPEISKFLTFSETLALASAYDLALFLVPEGSPLRGVLEGKTARRVLVAVGPEGGWSPRELEEAHKAGWTQVSLGKPILKVDTASLAAVTLLHYAFDPYDA